MKDLDVTVYVEVEVTIKLPTKYSTGMRLDELHRRASEEASDILHSLTGAVTVNRTPNVRTIATKPTA
jgi:hypothetical protein